MSEDEDEAAHTHIRIRIEQHARGLQCHNNDRAIQHNTRSHNHSHGHGYSLTMERLAQHAGGHGLKEKWP